MIRPSLPSLRQPVRLALIAFLATAARAQSLEIYSEFHRVDPFGAVVAPDRGLAAREILSPGVARNAYTAFHIAVSVPQKESYLLYVIPNPLTACRVAVYKEHFVRTPQGWIPDPLTELTRLPDFGVMPDPDDHIEGQTTRLYLLEIWLPPNADVARFRLEVQLKTGTWLVRPMEVRVVPARVPSLAASPGGRTLELPAIDQGADCAAAGALADYLAGTPLYADPHPMTVRGIIRRNATQDAALAASVQSRDASPMAVAQRALDLFRLNASLTPRVFGAEWYLKLRDFIYSLH